MTRIHRTGRDNWTAPSGYQRQSTPWARFERPADEPPVWLGALILAFGILTLIAAVLLAGAALHHLGQPRREASGASPASSRSASDAVEAGVAGQDGGR